MATRTERRRAAIDRRRAAARRGITAQVAARHRRARIRLAVGAFAVVVLIGGSVLWFASRGDDGPPNVELSGDVVDGAEGELGITAPLANYTVTYRQQNYTAASDEPTEQTLTFRMARPFSSEISITGGESPFTLVSTLGRRSSTGTDGTPVISAVAPSVGVADFRLDASLSDLVASGAFEVRERRKVLDRECQVYRTGSALEQVTITAPTADTYADVCIDSAGLLLEEVVYSAGSPVEHLTATAVTEESGAPITIDAEPTDTTNTLAEIDANTEPVDGYWTVATIPEGYELQARYALTRPAPTSDDTSTDGTSDTTADTTTDTATTLPTDASSTESTTADASTVPATTVAATSAGLMSDGALDGKLPATATTAPTTSTAASTTTPTTVPATDTTPPVTDTTAPSADTPVPAVETAIVYYDLYVNGQNVIIVSQGPTGLEPTPSGEGTSSTLDNLGEVTTSSGTEGTSITANPSAPASWFVNVSGTVDATTLQAIAATLSQG